MARTPSNFAVPPLLANPHTAKLLGDLVDIAASEMSGSSDPTTASAGDLMAQFAVQIHAAHRASAAASNGHVETESAGERPF